MRITITSVFVDDQARALAFYTDVLGFQVKHDVDLGGPRWITVTAAGDPDGVELLLEPAGHPAVAPFKDALVADGIPFTSFTVDDVHAEVERLRVRIVAEPAVAGPVTVATIDDTCGNLLQLSSG